MIRLTGRLICATSDEVETVRRHLPDHIRLTREEPGCLSFQVTQSADHLIWDVSEAFRDRAAFDAHQARTRASAWFQATAAIRREYQVEDLAD